MREDDWRNSDCSDGYFHRYNITAQDSDYVEETCELCGKQAYFQIIDGKSNNDIYLAHHIRQCLPPFHSLFFREFNNFIK